jgi:hypothetical protein
VCGVGVVVGSRTADLQREQTRDGSSKFPCSHTSPYVSLKSFEFHVRLKDDLTFDHLSLTKVMRRMRLKTRQGSSSHSQRTACHPPCCQAALGLAWQVVQPEAP